MAFVTEMYCIKCEQTKSVSIPSGHPTPVVCSQCKAKESEEIRKRHFRILDGMFVEERIRLVEEQLYDLLLAREMEGVVMKF